MKVEILPTFLRDLKKLKNEPVYSQIKDFSFIELKSFQTLSDIPHIKKIKEFHYRIRIGDYRIGFRFNDETITLMRVKHRKEIYRYFP